MVVVVQRGVVGEPMILWTSNSLCGNLLRPLIKIVFVLVPSGYIILKIKKEFLRR